MRESQHEPAVEIRKTQKSVKLCYSGWSWPIPNDLALSWIHMHPLLINNVSQILNPGHAKISLLQIGTQIMFSRCLEDLSDVVEVLFPSLVEWPQDVIHQLHEGCRSIFQSERHDYPFKKALIHFEGSIPHMGGFD